MKRILQLVTILAALATVSAQAQRGGPPGGGGGHGMPGGGGMGMPGGGHDGSRPGDFGGRNAGAPPPSTVAHGPQLGPQGRWWDDKKTSRSLNLSSTQQQRMDDIFESNKGQLLSLYSNFQHEEQKLSSMSQADLADEGKVFAGIDRVAQARAELEKQNAHILLQIRKELDAGQLAKLDGEMGR